MEPLERSLVYFLGYSQHFRYGGVLMLILIYVFLFLTENICCDPLSVNSRNLENYSQLSLA